MEWIKFGDKKPDIGTCILFIDKDGAHVGWYEGGKGDNDCYWIPVPPHPEEKKPWWK